MSHLILPVFRIVFSALLIFQSAFLSAQSPDEVFYPGRLWVQLDPSFSSRIHHTERTVELEELASVLGFEALSMLQLAEVRKPFWFAKSPEISEVLELRFQSSGHELTTARMLEHMPFVGYAERVPIMRTTFTPNDLGPQSGTNNQWFLWQIGAQNAWDITQGSTVIKVAIVDDAVLTTHPDLIPNLLPGWDVASNDNNPMPDNVNMSHGTHVAGIASAATNNGVGIASIGFNVKLIPVKSSNQAQIISDGYAGVVWAADNGAHVINMSWGGSGFSNTGNNIINYAHNAGCLNVAAAGNDNVSTIFYPAGYANCIAVASTTTNDVKSSFSNFGSWITVSAPGSSIRSTYFGSNYTPNYANNQGTSMASPLVAGLAGLVWSVNPQMSNVQVRECVVNTADNISGANPNFTTTLGSGRINAHNAVLCALSTVNAPPIGIIQSVNPTVCPGGQVQFNGSSLGGTSTGFQWSFPGGNPSSSTLQNPVVSYSGLGTYDVTLIVSNDFGSNSITSSGFVNVTPEAIDQFFFENFETGTLSSMGWSVVNPDNGIAWEIWTVGGATDGTKAPRVNLFNYSAQGQRDGLVSPVLDFSNHYNVKLDFKHAHRRRAQAFKDSLLIYVSTDGGATFPHKVFAAAESGQGTFATGSILNQNFIPANGNDWCFGGDIGSGCFTVNLSQFDGQTNVKLKFETYNDTGNNIYIDNVELSGNCLLVQAPPIAGFTVSNTSTCAGSPVQFIDQSVNIPTTYSWSFPGGSPATANMPTPVVTYSQPGVYPVSLTVSNPFGSDNITVTDYITVTEGFNLVVPETQVVSCAGVGVELSASGADSYSWLPNVALSSTTGSSVIASPINNITYTVTGTTGGCTQQQTIQVTVQEGPATPVVISENQVAFVMMNPPAVGGHYHYALPGTGWGSPNFNSISLEAQMLIARDGTAADSLLCNAAVNASEIAGKIAVVYRGSCEFGIKALNAQNAGAVAVIVVNNTANPELMEMGPGANGANVTVPVFMVSQATGAWLNASINSGNASARLGQFNGGTLTICPGQTVLLAGPGGLTEYLWTGGSTNPVIEIGVVGTYTCSIFGSNGCPTPSQAYNVISAVGTMPIIQQNQNLLSAPNVFGTNHQWYLNGSPVSGANSSVLEISVSGMYQVQMTLPNGCVVMSDPFNAVYVGVAENAKGTFTLYPVPTSGLLQMTWPDDQPLSTISILSIDGRLIRSYGNQPNTGGFMTMDVSFLAAGTYLLRYVGDREEGVIRFVKTD
jgi:serine protease